MQINRVAEFRNVHSIREDRLSLPALNMKKGDGYWTLSYGELRERVRGRPRRHGGIIDKFIGDTVNTASRLEGACKDFGRPLIVGEEVYKRLDDELKGRFTRLGEIPLKGKSAPTVVYGG